MQIINNTTPLTQRRIADKHPYSHRYRSFAARPGTGSVLIKESFDNGATYDTITTLTGSPTSYELVSFDKLIEIECTGNAVAVLGG